MTLEDMQDTVSDCIDRIKTCFKPGVKVMVLVRTEGDDEGKRGMKGVYQHCSEKHLHRYLAEFDFRYSNRVALGVDDQERADRTVKGMVGKRLTYRTPHGTAAE